jgi:UDP-GlcNAc:undecaprenyl-phosphate GlcNAc-1-phosphate transferase
MSLPFGLGALEFGALSILVTVFWIVCVTNAINLIDGLDGLAAGLALICTTAVAVIALYRQQVAVTAASVALVGSLAGFLRYNFNPARIFLGDSGSMLLGFLLAVLSIHSNQKGATAVALLAPILILGIPLLDTSLAVLRRLYRLGKRGAISEHRLSYWLRHASIVFLPDRAHLHHRLLDVGLSQRAAVIVLYLGAVLSALSALALVIVKSPVLAVSLLLVLGLLFLAFLVLFLTTRPRAAGSDPAAGRRLVSSRWLQNAWKPEFGDSTATPPE